MTMSMSIGSYLEQNFVGYFSILVILAFLVGFRECTLVDNVNSDQELSSLKPE